MMTRTDIHLDAMLRHLGAAYYESLHGRATRSDVTRALDTVEEHLKEHAPHPASTKTPARPPQAHPADGPWRRRWARRVSDVMTTTVVTVDRFTSYQEIDRLLTAHRISGMPVLTMGRHVAGVVSEADLLAVQDESARHARMDAQSSRRWRIRKPRRTALTAGALMTTPAITVHPDATIPSAARVMNMNHIRRLPVVDSEGKLVGVVSRRDLLSVFLRPDADITHDVRQVLDELALADPADIVVTVRNGVVTLTGTVEPAAGRHEDLVPLAIRLIWDIDGVVDVVNRLGETEVANPAKTA